MPPTAEEQVRFLENVERLLSEGRFVATYKYALLIALADLAVEVGNDSGAEMTVVIRRIADKFIELYWRQGRPYGAGVADGGSSGVLIQNTGDQAAIINLVHELQAKFGTLSAARRSAEWPGVLAQVATLLQQMPLWRLQLLRAGELQCLYRRGDQRGTITFLPGVVANLRRFHGLITRMAQSEWLRFVQSLPANQWILGATTDLSEFLFGSSRGALGNVRKPLRDLQSGRCFYCDGRLNDLGDVDHFIPWSKYPRNLVHNLVIAHSKCNSHKSDLLAGEPHLERWAVWVRDRDSDLTDIGTNAGLVIDRDCSHKVAEWSYEHAARLGAEVWLGGKKYGHLGESWRTVFLRNGPSPA